MHAVVLSFDCLPVAWIGCYGNMSVRTPRLDALAAEGVRFTRAFTCAPLTLPSHASLFTGTYPPHHGIHYNGTYALSDSAVTLAERLTSAGFVCGATVAAYVLHRNHEALGIEDEAEGED